MPQPSTPSVDVRRAGGPNQIQAAALRARGNELFKAGCHAEAAAAYTDGLALLGSVSAAADRQQRTGLLANRASCMLRLGNPAAAVADCEAALELEPLSAKLQLRLARALLLGGEPVNAHLAAAAAAAAVALQRPPPGGGGPAGGALPAAELAEVYRQAAAGVAAAAAHGCDVAAGEGGGLLHLPADMARVARASDVVEAAQALERGAEVLVLLPGVHDPTASYAAVRALASARAFSIVGVGRASLVASAGHAVFVESGQRAALARLRLAGDGEMAAVCVAADERPSPLRAQRSHVALVGCRVEGYSDGGLLVHGGAASLEGCTFVDCARAAVEVRQGGTLWARDCSMDACAQGVAAYGGARCVQLHGCRITRCRREGVLAAGAYENAATAAEAQLLASTHQRPWHSAAARRVTEEAEAWGKAHASHSLDVTLASCTVSGSGSIGVSLEAGCSASIVGCLLEANDPYSVLIKGSVDASIAACQVHFNGKPSKSLWAQLQSDAHSAATGRGRKLPAIKQSGVHVAVNYGGEVAVVGNAFIGAEELAVEQEALDAAPSVAASMKAMGMWSRPATTSNNSYHALGEEPPPLEALSARAAAGVQLLANRGRGARSAAAVAPPARQLRRIAATTQQEAWAPTATTYYAIGNTFGVDVSGGCLACLVQQCSGSQQRVVRVLLCACGDVRNLLATVAAVGAERWEGGGESSAAASAGGGESREHGGGGSRLGDSDAAAPPAPDTRRPPQLEVVLNDGNASMLARNVVMMYMLLELGAAPQAVLAVWANHALGEQEAELMRRACAALAERPWPAWLAASDSLDATGAQRQPGQEDAAAATPAGPPAGGRGAPAGEAAGKACGAAAASCSSAASSEASVRGVCRAWAGCTLSLAQLLAQRRVALSPKATRDAAVDLSMAALGAGDAARRDVAEYVSTGSLPLPGCGPPSALTQPNVTLLLAPELQYALYFSSSILRAVPLAPAGGGEASGVGSCALGARLLATVRPQLQRLLAAVRGGALRVVVALGDVLAMATDGGAGSGEGFDFIDTSNVADYTTLPAIVQACAPLLRRAPHARMWAESMVAWRSPRRAAGDSPAAAFVAACLQGVPLQLHEALLGVRFVRGRPLLPLNSQEGVRLEWAPCSSAARDAEAQPSMAAATAAAAGSGDFPAARRGADEEAGVLHSEARGHPLSACRLLLELRPALRRLVGDLLTPAPADAPYTGAANASPLVLAHLLCSALPASAAASLMRAMLRCEVVAEGGGAPSRSTNASTTSAHAAPALFKWELSMHASIQAGRMPLERVCYPADPGLRLLPYDVNERLLVALSAQPLAPGHVALSGVKQLISSFVWDEAHATAWLLVPASLCEATGAPPAWARYVTLCAMGRDGLCAVGQPRQLAGLERVGLGTAVAPWRHLAPAAGCSSVELGDAGLDCSLVERVKCGGGKSSRSSDGADDDEWRAVVQRQQGGGAGTAVVDVLAPGPLATHAPLHVEVVGDELVVTLGPRRAGSGQEVEATREAGHAPVERIQQQSGQQLPDAAAKPGVPLERGRCAVALPLGMQGARWHGVKCCRPLGLVSVVLSAVK